MYKLIGITVIQSLCLVTCQVCLKLAMERIDKFSWTWKFFGHLLVNWPLLLSGLFGIIATVLWMYILKNYDFSLAYPLASMSYIFGMFAAIIIFHEMVPFTRWIGLLLIIVGVIFIQMK